MKRLTPLVCLLALAVAPLIVSVEAQGYAPLSPGRGRAYRGTVHYRDQRTMSYADIHYGIIIWWTDETFASVIGITQEGKVYMAEGEISYIDYGYQGTCDKYVFDISGVVVNGHFNPCENGYGAFYDFYWGSDKIVLVIYPDTLP